MANDPAVAKSATVPYLLIEGVDHLDDSADEDVANIQVGLETTVLERRGLVSDWVRRDVGTKNASVFTMEAFTKTTPNFDQIGSGSNLNFCMPFQGGSTEGDRCFFGIGPASNYQIRAAVNEWLMATFNLPPDGAIARGYVLREALSTGDTGALDGTVITLPALTAGNKLVFAAHVTGGTFVDATVSLERDDIDPMTTPETVITLSQFTSSPAADFGEDDTASAETKYRVDLATTGGITSITWAAFVGIVSN